MKRKVEIKTGVKKDEGSKFVQRVRLSSRWMIPHLAHPEISENVSANTWLLHTV